MLNPLLLQSIPGASNFRAMLSCDVFGVAMSTVEGIRRVLQKVTAPRPGREEAQEVSCTSSSPWKLTLEGVAVVVHVNQHWQANSCSSAIVWYCIV